MFLRSPRVQKWLKVFLIFTTVLAPGLAMADGFREIAGTWDIYAYANGQQLYEILHAINGWMTGGGFIAFITGMAIMGLLGVSLMGFLSGSPQKAAGYLMAIIVSSYVFTSMGTRVVITDMVTGDTKPALEVSAAAGLPLGVVSEIGGYVAEAIETTFQTVDSGGIDASYPAMMAGTGDNSTGMPFGGTYGVMRDIGNFKIADPTIRSNVTEYLRYCFIPFIDTWYAPKKVLESDSFWEELKKGVGGTPPKNQYILYNQLSGGSELIACDDAHGRIQGDLAQHVPDILGKFTGASQLVAGANQNASTLITDWLSNSAASNTNMALNAAMVEATREGFQRTAHALESDTMMVAINTENARRAQTAGWYTTAILFRDMVGYFFAILQGFIVAITPLVAIMAFMPGMGLKLIGGYSKVLIWMMMWWPSLAIVNYIMNSYYKANIASTAEKCGGITFGCAASLGLMNDMTQNMMIAAGLMATFVPAIMWGIISQGSFALTSVLDRASGAGYATQAGGNIAHGSARVGDVSLNNVSANKHDTTWRNTSGIEPSQTHSGGGQHVSSEDRGGVRATTAGGAHSASVTEDLSLRHSVAKSREESAGKEASSTRQVMTNSMVDDAAQLTNSQKYGNSYTNTYDTKEDAAKARNQDIGIANGLAREIQSGERTSEEALMYVAKELSGKIGVSRGRNIAGALAATFGAGVRDTDTWQRYFSDSDALSYNYKNSQGEKVSDGDAFSVGESGKEQWEAIGQSSQSFSKRTSDSISKAAAATEKHQRAVAAVQRVEDSIAYGRQSTVSGSTSQRDAQRLVRREEEARGNAKKFGEGVDGEIEQRKRRIDEDARIREESYSDNHEKIAPKATSKVVDPDEVRQKVSDLKETANENINQAQAHNLGAAHNQNARQAAAGASVVPDIDAAYELLDEYVEEALGNPTLNGNNSAAVKAGEEARVAALLQAHPEERDKLEEIFATRDQLTTDSAALIKALEAERDEAMEGLPGFNAEIINADYNNRIAGVRQDYHEAMNEQVWQEMVELGKNFEGSSGQETHDLQTAVAEYTSTDTENWGPISGANHLRRFERALLEGQSGDDFHGAVRANTNASKLAVNLAQIESGVNNYTNRQGSFNVYGFDEASGNLVYTKPTINDRGEEVLEYYRLDASGETQDFRKMTSQEANNITHRPGLAQRANNKPTISTESGSRPNKQNPKAPEKEVGKTGMGKNLASKVKHRRKPN